MLTDALKEIKHNWMQFAKKLGLPQDIICELKGMHSSSDRCLEKALQRWLNGDYNKTAYGPPTFGRVCAAVANPKGGNNKDLAQKMADTLVR